MCNTKCNNKPCCQEADFVCCAPLVHCCGGYSEHNNCCPHNRCCNQHCCEGCCCEPMCPCCYKLKKAFDDLSMDVNGDVRELRSQVVRDEALHADDIDRLTDAMGDLAEKENNDVNRLDGEIARLDNKNALLDDALAAERAARIAADADNDNAIDAVRNNAIYDVTYDSGSKEIKARKGANGSLNPVVKIIPYSDRGATNGVASLESGKVPASQLPSYVDDVIEFNGTANRPATGEPGKIYVDTATNLTYRWTAGAGYIEISPSVGLGENSSTAYPGNKGKLNADDIAAIQGLIPSTASTSNKLATIADIPNVASTAGSGTISYDGGTTTIQAAITDLLTKFNNLSNQILWEVDGSDSTKVVAKSNRGAKAAGFFDTTVS